MIINILVNITDSMILRIKLNLNRLTNNIVNITAINPIIVTILNILSNIVHISVDIFLETFPKAISSKLLPKLSVELATFKLHKTHTPTPSLKENNNLEE